MPTYEYFCPANGRSVEVLHPMSKTLATWGDVCAAQDLDPADTAPETPVEKKWGAGVVLTNSRAELNDGPAGPPGGCCGGGCGRPG